MKAPIQNVTAASGEEMFKSYCAACHGKDAMHEAIVNMSISNLVHYLESVQVK